MGLGGTKFMNHRMQDYVFQELTTQWSNHHAEQGVNAVESEVKPNECGVITRVATIYLVKFWIYFLLVIS